MYAVLFDIDGTLLQSGGAGQLAFAEAFAQEFGVDELSGDVPFAGRSDRAISLDLMQVHGVDPSEANWQRFRDAYLGRLPAALAKRQGRVLPGVVKLLQELSRHEHALIGILTGNIREGAHHKLVHYGLREHFAFGGYGDECHHRDDIAAMAAAEAKRHGADRHGISLELTGAMVIGDTVHDVTCARAIGAVAVAVPTGGATREALIGAQPDLLLDDLTAADELLNIVAAARSPSLEGRG
jgi:phosphoglycolate phosphatase